MAASVLDALVAKFAERILETGTHVGDDFAIVEANSIRDVCRFLRDDPDMSFDWHSRIIARVMGHPALGSGLRLINPLLARLACRPDPSLAAQPAAASLPTPLADLTN